MYVGVTVRVGVRVWAAVCGAVCATQSMHLLHGRFRALWPPRETVASMLHHPPPARPRRTAPLPHRRVLACLLCTVLGAATALPASGSATGPSTDPAGAGSMQAGGTSGSNTGVGVDALASSESGVLASASPPPAPVSAEPVGDSSMPQAFNLFPSSPNPAAAPVPTSASSSQGTTVVTPAGADALTGSGTASGPASTAAYSGPVAFAGVVAVALTVVVVLKIRSRHVRRAATMGAHSGVVPHPVSDGEVEELAL